MWGYVGFFCLLVSFMHFSNDSRSQYEDVVPKCFVDSMILPAWRLDVVKINVGWAIEWTTLQCKYRTGLEITTVISFRGGCYMHLHSSISSSVIWPILTTKLGMWWIRLGWSPEDIPATIGSWCTSCIKLLPIYISNTANLTNHPGTLACNFEFHSKKSPFSLLNRMGY